MRDAWVRHVIVASVWLCIAQALGPASEQAAELHLGDINLVLIIP